MKTLIKRIHYGANRSTMEWTDRLKQKLVVDTDRIKSATVIAQAIVNSNQSKTMGTYGALGERLAAKKAARAKFTDDLAKQLDEMDAKEPAVQLKAQSVAQSQAEELNDLDSDLRQLSNSLNGHAD